MHKGFSTLEANAMQNTNILIADDTTLMRRLLAFQLATESDMRVMGEAKDGRVSRRFVEYNPA